MRFMRILTHFVTGILIAVLLGWRFQEAGADGGALRTGITTLIAVLIIFFNQGLILPTESVKRGILHWRFHLFCFLYSFLFFPLVTGACLYILNLTVPGYSNWDPDLLLGFLFLAILPTTISTAVIYTAKSGGSVAAALFTTAFTNVAGIFIVPLLVLGVAGKFGYLGEGGGFSPGPVILKIVLLLLLPLVMGQLLRPKVKGWVENWSGRLRNVNVILIYFIVFAAFANSFHRDTWSQFSPAFLGFVFLITGGMLIFFSGMAWLALSLLDFNREDRIAGFFCASQKTLAAGIPLAGSIFLEAGPDISMVILPLMIYHFLQLLFHGYFAGEWEKYTADKQSEAGV